MSIRLPISYPSDGLCTTIVKRTKVLIKAEYLNVEPREMPIWAFATVGHVEEFKDFKLAVGNNWSETGAYVHSPTYAAMADFMINTLFPDPLECHLQDVHEGPERKTATAQGLASRRSKRKSIMGQLQGQRKNVPNPLLALPALATDESVIALSENDEQAAQSSSRCVKKTPP